MKDWRLSTARGQTQPEGWAIKFCQSVGLGAMDQMIACSVPMVIDRPAIELHHHRNHGNTLRKLSRHGEPDRPILRVGDVMKSDRDNQLNMLDALAPYWSQFGEHRLRVMQRIAGELVQGQESLKGESLTTLRALHREFCGDTV